MAASLLNCPFPFSDSRKNNYFGPKACGPGSWASRTQAATLARLVRVWGLLGQQVQSIGLAQALDRVLVSPSGIGTAEQDSDLVPHPADQTPSRSSGKAHGVRLWTPVPPADSPGFC